MLISQGNIVPVHSRFLIDSGRTDPRGSQTVIHYRSSPSNWSKADGLVGQVITAEVTAQTKASELRCQTKKIQQILETFCRIGSLKLETQIVLVVR